MCTKGLATYLLKKVIDSYFVIVVGIFQVLYMLYMVKQDFWQGVPNILGFLAGGAKYPRIFGRGAKYSWIFGRGC